MMIKTLLRKQLMELFQSWVINRKTGAARTKKGTVGSIVGFAALMLALAAAFFAMGMGLGAGTLNRGCDWLYFSLTGLISIALGVFGSVFNTYASLYLPKDNELMFSLPIPGRTLILARSAEVYIMSLLYSAWVWVPCTVAYWIQVEVTAATVVFPILLTFVLALFVTVLSCLLGWVVALIASRIKGKSYVKVLMTLLFLAAYYLIYFRALNYLQNIVQHLDEIQSAMTSWLHYLTLTGKAAAGSAGAFALTVVVTLVLAVACFAVLSRTFLKLALPAGTSASKSRREIRFDQSSPDRALLRREYRHFTSDSSWMLNGGIGLLILPILGVVALIKGPAANEALSSLPELIGAMPVLFISAFCMIISTDIILPPSVSLEGKSLWLVQSLPVEPWQVLRAKERMNVQLTVIPLVLTAVLVGIGFRLGVLPTVLIVLAGLAYTYFISDFGLMLGLKKPNLHWTNSTVVIKQGAAAGFSLFGGWLISMMAGALGYLCSTVMGAVAALAVLALLFAAISLLMRRWLRRKGCEIFSTLG